MLRITRISWIERKYENGQKKKGKNPHIGFVNAIYTQPFAARVAGVSNGTSCIAKANENGIK